MLSAIKNSKIGIILAIVFGISLFLIKGGNKYSGILGVGANDVAIVGDVKISNIQYQRIFDLNKKKFSEITNKDLSYEEMKLLGLDKESLNMLIREAILKNEFNNLSLFLDDEVIAKAIKDFVPYLYDEKNRIIEENLSTFLRNQNLNLENFIDIVSSQIIRENYENNLLNNIFYPEKSAANITSIDNHKRKTEYLVLPIDQLNLQININESDIKKYYENNKNFFKEPEKRSIDYILIDPKDYLELFDIDNKQIENYYNNNLDIFTIKEKRSFIQFNFNNEIDAENFKSIIYNISSYYEIKKAAENNNIRFTEYEKIDKDQILKEISDVVFNINKDHVSEIITSPLAFHLTYIKDIYSSYNSSIEDSKNKIINILKYNYSIDYIQNLLENIDNDIINNIDLDEISKKYNLKIDKFIKVKNENYDNLKGLILNNAFNEKKDFISNIYDGKDENSYFLFKVVEIIEATTKSYELSKSDATKYLENDEIEKLSYKKINELINLNDNISFLEKISSDYAISINKEILSSKNETLPNEFVRKIFNSKINDPISFYNKNNIYIAKVKSLIIDDLNLNQENANIRINNSISNELKNTIIEKIGSEIDVKINQDLINLLSSNI